MKKKNDNKFKKLGYIFFLIGTVMIMMNSFLASTDILPLSESVWNAILMIGTILDLIAIVFFLRAHKDDTGRYY